MSRSPNLVFVFADQWRAQAFGYAGDPNVRTPRVDAFSDEALNFGNAISGCPVCCAYRASLMSGRQVFSHGVFLNDVRPRIAGPSFADALSSGGYDTAYIGKWHCSGGARLESPAPDLRSGFRFWRGVECAHEYNDSIYYDERGGFHRWKGYDAEAQTREAVEFIRTRDSRRPFALFLSWGPPHSPYDTAPAEFRALYQEDSIRLRPNVTAEFANEARSMLAGYYAHCSALDSCFGALLDALDAEGLRDGTAVVFTSDHGDMLRSQGRLNKQMPWDESVRVPFLFRWPAGCVVASSRCEFIDAPDLMPSLLSLFGVGIPSSVEGRDLSGAFLGGAPDSSASATLLLNVYGFHQTFGDPKAEWRAVRTGRHSYVIGREGPWLLYDNIKDPFQLDNIVDRPEAAGTRSELAALLAKLMAERGDSFEPGVDYVERFGHHLNAKGDVPYFNWERERREYFKKLEESA